MMFDGITNKDFTPAEWKALQQFSEKAKKISEEKGIFDTEQWNPVTISESANFNIFAYSKEGLVMQAIWIIFFTAMKKKNIPLKFPTVSSFLEAYEGRFDDREEEDQKVSNLFSFMFFIIVFLPCLCIRTFVFVYFFPQYKCPYLYLCIYNIPDSLFSSFYTHV